MFHVTDPRLFVVANSTLFLEVSCLFRELLDVGV